MWGGIFIVGMVILGLALLLGVAHVFLIGSIWVKRPRFAGIWAAGAVLVCLLLWLRMRDTGPGGTFDPDLLLYLFLANGLGSVFLYPYRRYLLRLESAGDDDGSGDDEGSSGDIAN